MGGLEISGSFTFATGTMVPRTESSPVGQDAAYEEQVGAGSQQSAAQAPIGKMGPYGVNNTLPARKVPWCTASFRQVPERPMGPLSSESRIDRDRASEARIGVTPRDIRTTTHLWPPLNVGIASGLEFLDQLVTDLINGLVTSHVEEARNVGGYFYTS